MRVTFYTVKTDYFRYFRTITLVERSRRLYAKVLFLNALINFTLNVNALTPYTCGLDTRENVWRLLTTG